MYCVCEGTICFPCDLYIKEGDGLVLFCFHGEFDERMLVVQVGEEILKCRPAMGPNHEGVVHIAEPKTRAKISILDGV